MWNNFIDLKDSLSIYLEGQCGFPTRGTFDWDEDHDNQFFSNEKVEMAHISVIDMRETRKMWMMHVACFARPEYPMPIYGYDVVIGQNKVTGCFHDISPTSAHMPCETKFQQMASAFNPERERELPEWAQAIFSPDMVACGATKKPRDIEFLTYMGLQNMWNWFDDLETVTKSADPFTVMNHETAKATYCENQLKNANSNNVMVALGLEKDYVEKFKRIQFPY